MIKLRCIAISIIFILTSFFSGCETPQNDTVYIPPLEFEQPKPIVPMIKVRLSQHSSASSAKVNIIGQYKIFLTDEDKDELTISDLGNTFIISPLSGGFVLKNSENPKINKEIKANYFRISPDTRNLTLIFGGNDELSVKGETVIAKPKPDRAGNFNPDIFDIIIRTDLETYCAQVLFNEMPASFHVEALKAQSIATRTYAFYKVLENNERKNFAWAYDLESTTADTVFDPTKLEQKAVEICNETFGNVLSYKDNKGNSLLMIAYYHSTCGGATATVFDFEGKFKDLPPFQGVISDECKISPMFSWTNKYSWKAWRQKLIQRNYATNTIPDTLKGLEITDKDKFGRAKELTFTFDNHPSLAVKAYQFRFQVAGAGKNELPSVLIKSVKITGDEIEISGNGWGHGMGLCQYCAHGLGLKGKGYREILGKFYPLADIVRHY